MKKIHPSGIVFLVLMLSFLRMAAQPIVEGEKALNEGQYEKAREYFTIVIREGSGVTPFELALAHYYRAWTWIKSYGAGPADLSSPAADPSGEMLLKAYDDLITAVNYDDGRLTKRINDLLIQLEPGLVQYGLVMLNRAESLKGDDRKFTAQAGKATEYLEKAISIKGNYVSYDLLGQAYLLTGDSGKALANFKLAGEDYRLRPPSEPDFMIGYAFFRQAVIYSDHLADEDRCLLSIQSGIALLAEEYQRASAAHTSDSTGIGGVRKAYLQVYSDLRTLELETYLKSTTRIEQAQAEFRKEMAVRPDDAGLIIAYASLLEKSDPDVSVSYYRKALELEPDNEVALYNIGAVSFNQGKKYFDQGILEQDPDKAALYMEQARHYFSQARPAFEAIFRKHPDDPQAISALSMICFALDDTQGYEYYRQLENE